MAVVAEYVTICAECCAGSDIKRCRLIFTWPVSCGAPGRELVLDRITMGRQGLGYEILLVRTVLPDLT